MHPENEFDQAIARFRENRNVVRGLFADLEPDAASWRSAPGRWSMAECVEHLNLTGKAYLTPMEACVREGHAAGKTSDLGSFRHGRILNWLIGKLEPGAGGRMKTRSMVAPALDLDAAAVVREFEDLGTRLVAAVESARGLDLARNTLQSPIASLVRMSLGQAFRMVYVHEDRHLDQARRVRGRSGFPGVSAPGP